MGKKSKTKDVMNLDGFIVTKSNAFINDTGFNLNEVSDKLIMLVIAHIQPGDINFRSLTFDKNSLSDFMGLNPKNGARQIDEAVRELNTKELIIPGKDGHKGTTWLAGYSLETKGYVSIEISDILRPFLLNLRTHFTQMLLKTLLSFTAHYARRFYELFRMEYAMNISKSRANGSNEVDFSRTVEELRFWFNLGEKYPLYADFKRRVIKKSLLAINETEDLFVEMTENRNASSRKVESLSFKVRELGFQVKELSNTKKDAVVLDRVVITEKTRKRLLAYGFRELSKLEEKKFNYIDLELSEVEKLINKYKSCFDSYVSSKVDLVERKLKQRIKVKNTGAYLRSALRENWIDELIIEEDVRKSEALQKRKQREKELEVKDHISRIDEEITALRVDHNKKVWKIIGALILKENDFVSKLFYSIPLSNTNYSIEENLKKSSLLKAYFLDKMKKSFPDEFMVIDTELSILEKKKEMKKNAVMNGTIQTEIFK